MNGNGLAVLIIAAMILITFGGLLLGALLGRTVARNRGWSAAKQTVVSAGLAALGVGGGVLVVFATFYESTWAPPPQVTFTPAAEFSQSWVIILEDPSSTNRLVWQGLEVPFFGKRTAVRVPPGGIVRVHSFGDLSGRADTSALWSDGASSTSQAAGLAPKSSNARYFIAFNRETPASRGQAEPPFVDGDALGAYIAARERLGQ
jgi:hypothetical protein